MAGGVVRAEVKREEEAHKETAVWRDMPGDSARWLDRLFWYELVEEPWRLMQTQTEDCVWEIVEDDL